MIIGSTAIETLAKLAAESKLIVTLKGKNAISVENINEAVKVAATYRDTSDYGFGIGSEKYYRDKAGRVYQGTRLIAQIHYNGRIEAK